MDIISIKLIDPVLLSLAFTRLWKVHKNEPFKDVQTLSQECCLPKSDVFSSSNPQSGIIMNESIIIHPNKNEKAKIIKALFGGLFCWDKLKQKKNIDFFNSGI